MKTECPQITITEIINMSENSYNELCRMKDQSPSKYVIANSIYHFQGEGNCIKDTGLVVTCTTNINKVKLFDTYKEAYDNIDFYLIDGNRRPIELKAITVEEYFNKCKELYDEFISFLKKQLLN